MIISMYAMIKLGVPFIPVDEVFPIERVKKIIQSAKSDLLLNTTPNKLNIKETNEVNWNGGKLQVQKNKQIFLTDKIPSADPIIYLIFTSGSTGEPKGVQITNESVEAFVHWIDRDFDFTEKEVFINFGMLSFDFSLFEVFMFGYLGASLILNNGENDFSPEAISARIEKYNGTIWMSTPSFAFLFLKFGVDYKLTQIRKFILAGEVLPHSLAVGIKSRFNKAQLVNAYGPTEATIIATYIEITNEIIKKYNEQKFN